MRLMLLLACVACVAIGCGGGRGRGRGTSTPTTPIPERAADWLVPLLPDGAQLVVEIDLARLRANPVVGEIATKLLTEQSAESRLPGLPIEVAGSPLASADALVLGAYGVGTAQATTVILLVTKADIPSAVRVAADIVVLGPRDWVDQIANRAAIGKLTPDAPAPIGAPLTVTSSQSIATLRDHAMPAKAPGAVVRLSAQLSFDARLALARVLGLEAAPAQISIWADVVDDFALIIDMDAADPGEKNVKVARARVAKGLSRVLTAVAAEPSIRAAGISNNIANPHVIEQGTWVRAIVTVGPRQLQRAAARAKQ